MAHDQYDYPDAPIAGPDGILSLPWAQLFTRWKIAIASVQQSGPTAGRPVKLLWIGRRYFDTDLGKPIWYDANGSTGWCLATGVAA